MRFSVILITHNESRWLINWITKMAVQEPDEFIIIDNASTDNSQELIRCLIKKFPKIRLVELKENTGAFGGFIEGCREATNDFISCYSPDDEVASNYIAKMKQMMTDYPIADMYTCNAKVIREGKEYSRILYPYDTYISPDYMVKICKIGMAKMITTIGMIVRKQVVLDMWERGGKNTKADFDAAFGYYMIFDKGIVNCADKLVTYRSYPNSWGPSSKTKEKQEALAMAKYLFSYDPVVYNRAVESRIWGTAYQLKQKIGLKVIMKLPKWVREAFYRWFYNYNWRVEKL
jgi:glycosyltransferase involved in cell wall biosynthesis